jgi:ankyrin repeat protein
MPPAPPVQLAAEASALARAAFAGDEARVKALLASGANPDDRWDGRPALGLAASKGHLGVLKVLLAAGASVDGVDNNGNTALHYAATVDGQGAVDLLIRAGVPLNVQNRKQGFTALLNAAGWGLEGAVKSLVAAGANPSIKTKNGHDAVSMARGKGFESIARFLESTGGGLPAEPRRTGLTFTELRAAMIDAVKGNDAARFAALLEGKDARDMLERECVNVEPGTGTCRILMGEWAMTTAAGRGWTGLLKPMIARRIGVDMDRPIYASKGWHRGYTAMTYAAAAGQGQAARLLVEAGADVHHVNPDGTSALAWALASGDAELTRALLDRGASPDTPVTMKGMRLTPLHVAAMTGNRSLYEDLLRRGAQARPDDRGRLPGYYVYWLTGDTAAAVRGGYAEARDYEARKRQAQASGAPAPQDPGKAQLDQDLRSLSGGGNGGDDGGARLLSSLGASIKQSLGAAKAWGGGSSVSVTAAPEIDTSGGGASGSGKANPHAYPDCRSVPDQGLGATLMEASTFYFERGRVVETLEVATQPCFFDGEEYRFPIRLCGYTLYYSDPANHGNIGRVFLDRLRADPKSPVLVRATGMPKSLKCNGYY